MISVTVATVADCLGGVTHLVTHPLPIGYCRRTMRAGLLLLLIVAQLMWWDLLDKVRMTANWEWARRCVDRDTPHRALRLFAIARAGGGPAREDGGRCADRPGPFRRGVPTIRASSISSRSCRRSAGAPCALCCQARTATLVPRGVPHLTHTTARAHQSSRQLCRGDETDRNLGTHAATSRRSGDLPGRHPVPRRGGASLSQRGRTAIACRHARSPWS